jgi:hypothetical protein
MTLFKGNATAGDPKVRMPKVYGNARGAWTSRDGWRDRTMIVVRSFPDAADALHPAAQNRHQ